MHYSHILAKNHVTTPPLLEAESVQKRFDDNFGTGTKPKQKCEKQKAEIFQPQMDTYTSQRGCRAAGEGGDGVRSDCGLAVHQDLNLIHYPSSQ